MKRAGANRVRIIGGEHRGRRLQFPPIPGLRPTADRVRETLFNWLRPVIAGARCADLFAGSGALGLEAASRGASQVLLVEKAAPAARRLADNVATLGLTETVTVTRADTLRLLQTPPAQPYDVVFLDPPYAAGLLTDAMQALEQFSWLGAEAWIYLEQDSSSSWPALPATWKPYKQGTGGQAIYCLAKRVR